MGRRFPLVVVVRLLEEGWGYAIVAHLIRCTLYEQKYQIYEFSGRAEPIDGKHERDLAEQKPASLGRGFVCPEHRGVGDRRQGQINERQYAYGRRVASYVELYC